MACRDHALDLRIVEAARAEFLEHGFQKASLHQIARRAGITTGALYTRYKSKDDLFCSLIDPALEEIGGRLASVEPLYRQAGQDRDPEGLLRAIQAEEQIYLDLLFLHYDACVLLFCKSGGSSLDARLSHMMQLKAEQTVDFFRRISSSELDFSGVELIMSGQFYYYRQMLQRGYTREKAVACMKTVDLFLEAGWKAVFDRVL